jgi:threonine/homoserine/homoserine lactone efflux protein
MHHCSVSLLKDKKNYTIMSTAMILSFLSASILLALMPGPDNILVLTESITKGKRNGIALSSGLSLGVIVHTIVIATGLAVVIQQSESVFTVIKIFGALYLFYLAYKTFQEKTSDGLIISDNPTNQAQIKNTFFSLFKKGLLMNILNPKVTLFFIAFLPQFVTENGFPFTLQIIILGTIFMIQAFIIFSTIAIVSAGLRPLIKSPKFWKNIKWAKIVVLCGLGLFLFVA